jgi:H+/Cl- antiporter ClcA
MSTISNFMPIGYKQRATMDHLQNKMWGFACGLTGGIGKYFMQAGHTEWFIKLAGAAVTALICGFVGAVGAWIFHKIKHYFLKFKKPRI